MGLDEAGHLVRRPRQIAHVVDAFAGAAEEARRTMFRHIAAWRDDGCLGQEIAPQRQKLVLIAPRAVEDEEQRTARRTGQHLVSVSVLAHGLSLPASANAVRDRAADADAASAASAPH